MKVDMSARGVTARLKRASQLRRLCLLLGKAKAVDFDNPSTGSGQRLNPAEIGINPSSENPKCVCPCLQ